VSERYTFLTAQVADVDAAKAGLIKLLSELTQEMRGLFTENFAKIAANFSRVFAELFGGGRAELTLTQDEDVLESGVEIFVQPPGKIIKNLALLSGGEQAFVAIAIYFAILKVRPAPFCLLDEIEAALDDVNVVRFAAYLRQMSRKTQFIAITHRRGTMEEADMLYGVTMQEEGVSKLLNLNVAEVEEKLGIK
jgi:chromosome segregation protein